MDNQAQGVVTEAPTRDNEQIRDFISRAVHDLREPLRAIRLGAQLALASQGEDAAEKITKGKRYLDDGVDRIESLLRDIAEYCYEEVRELEASPTDLETVLIEARNEVAEQLKSTGAQLTHDPLPVVSGNFASLAGVFRSLISNACKFRGAAAPIVHIGCEQQGLEWIFSVRDNCLGFDPTYRERIFKPFEKLGGKQYPGSGLGLSFAKRVIEQHGGQIWAESSPGEGSTFWFTLPVAS